MKKVVVACNINKHLYEGVRSQKDIEEYVEKVFGMPLPSHIHISFTDALVERMKRIRDFAKAEKIAELTIGSSNRFDTEHSYIELYANEARLAVSQYTDFGKQWRTIDRHPFTLKTSFFESFQFSGQFIYKNSYTEFVFESDLFHIEDIA